MEWAEEVAAGREEAEDFNEGQWLIGWRASRLFPINGGEPAYAGSDLALWADEIGLSWRSVNRVRWVAGRFSPEHRSMFPNLSFSHFEAVTRIAGQDIEAALDWLETADRHKWRVSRLRDAVRVVGGGSEGDEMVVSGETERLLRDAISSLPSVSTGDTPPRTGVWLRSGVVAGPYEVDVMLSEYVDGIWVRTVAVELDGPTHSTERSCIHDRRRDRRLFADGIVTVRFWVSEADLDVRACAREALQLLTG